MMDRGGLAALFAGQLSERVGMGRELLEKSDRAMNILAHVERRSGQPLIQAMLEGPEETLRRDEIAQPAVFALGCALWGMLEGEASEIPGAIAGYSLGNYAALVAAGAVDLDPALDVLMRVLELVAEHRVEGGMAAAIGLPESAVRELCKCIEADGEVVEPANLNAENQIVVAGSRGGIRRFLELAEPRCLKVLDLPMDLPIHSRLMRPVAEVLARELPGRIPVRTPRIPFYSTSAGKRLVEPGEIIDVLVHQVVRPSLWARTIRVLTKDGYRRFAEIGSSEVLTRMLRWIDRGVEGMAVEGPGDLAKFCPRVEEPVR